MSNRAIRRAEERRAAKLARKAANPSPAQLAANRENAQHSTGPVTSAGKAAVSQNRTVHGLNYNAATFRVLPCEDQADYDRLLQSLIEDHQPGNATESLLVLTMAQHRWLFDRASRLQETCFDPATGQVADQKLFALYLRYATTHERAFHKCLNDLLKLRTTKQNSEFGFESQNRKTERHEYDMRIKQIDVGIKEMESLHCQNKFLHSLSGDDLRKFMQIAGIQVKAAA